MVNVVEEAPNIRIKYPIGFVPDYLVIQKSQRTVTSPVWSEAHHFLIETGFENCL